MGFKCGIVGLPNVGKSTLFNALTQAGVAMENYPFCTIDPHVGVVAVPDERLTLLEKVYAPDKVIPTTLQFVDIAGLVQGASKGEGLGNQFLSHIQAVDALIHIVRCFEDNNVAHIDDRLDPQRDIEIVETEILLKDLETVENRIHKIQLKARSGDQQLKKQMLIMEEIRELLIQGKAVKNYHAHPEEMAFIKELALLSNKPVLIVGNISEDEATSGKKTSISEAFEKFALATGNLFLTLSANLELEMSALKTDECQLLMQEWHIAESGVDRLIHAGYALLRLITFFTMESNICQAWTVTSGSTAVKAAAQIHSSFEDRFIKAEVRHWTDVEQLRSDKLMHEQGLIHIEGKSYIVRDGDVMTFKLAAG
jgi:GTP-binding protein YchF